MSKQRVRSILAGTALVITLNVTFPVSSEAAGFSPVVDSRNMVELVLHWVSSLWNGGHALAKTVAAPAPGKGTPAGTVLTCGGEQGVCIDPNG